MEFEKVRSDAHSRGFVFLKASSCVGTPAVDLFGVSWAEQVENKTIDRFVIPFYDGYPIIWCETNGQPAGFIHYQDTGVEYWVRMSYVAPIWRRRGLYSEMVDILKELARKEKKLRISGGTFHSNHATRAAYAATGRTFKSETWTLDL